MSFGLVSAGVQVIGGVMQHKAGKKQQKLSKQAMKDMNPFAPYRQQYAEQLGTLMKDPSGFLNNPLYKAAFSQGQQAVMRGFAGKGFIGSGNFAAGLQGFGMSFAYDAQREQQKFLAHLAGADMGGSAGPLEGYNAGVNNEGGGWGQLLGGLSQGASSLFGGGLGNMAGGPALFQGNMGNVSVAGPSNNSWMPSGDLSFGL
jgi:hypothetical protein